jgi:hypothetical protein
MDLILFVENISSIAYTVHCGRQAAGRNRHRRLILQRALLWCCALTAVAGGGCRKAAKAAAVLTKAGARSSKAMNMLVSYKSRHK